MLQRKFVRARNDLRNRGYLAANPLWALEELRNLRNPPFVADPEFTPFEIDALGCHPKSGSALPSDRSYSVRREFSISDYLGATLNTLSAPSHPKRSLLLWICPASAASFFRS